MPDTWNNVPLNTLAILIGMIGIIITTIGSVRFVQKNEKIKSDESSRLNPQQQKVYIVRNTGNKFIIFIGVLLIILFIFYFAFSMYFNRKNDKEIPAPVASPSSKVNAPTPESILVEDERFSRFFEKKDNSIKNDGKIEAYTRKTITPFIDIELKTEGTIEIIFSTTECFINGIFVKDKEKIARFMVGSDTKTLYYYNLEAFIDTQRDYDTFYKRGYGSNDLIIAMANKEVKTYDKRMNHKNKYDEDDVNEIGYFMNEPCFIVSILEDQENEQGEIEVYAQVIYKSDEENDGGYKLGWIYYDDVTASANEQK